MAVDDKEINQTIRVEGEVNEGKVNEGFRKASEWWSRLKAAVGELKSGGTQFIATHGDVSTPSYRFRNRTDSGLWLDGALGDIHLSRTGQDYGAINGGNYAVSLIRNTNQTAPPGTTTISWSTTVDIDRGGMWKSSDPTKVYAPVEGSYLIIGNAYFTQTDANQTYFRVYLTHNGSAGNTWREDRAVISVTHQNGLCYSRIVYAKAGDYFQTLAGHNSPGTETILANYAFMHAKRIG